MMGSNSTSNISQNHRSTQVTPLESRRFETLDSFRGICAVLVVLFHLRGVDSISSWAFIRNSDLFVEFFFVLSGFVLTHGYAYRNEITFRRYFTSRVFRIFPLHIFILMLFVVLEFGKLAATKFNLISLSEAPFTGSTDVSELIPNMLLIHAWTPLTMHLSFNLPSWSISIEFYMYLLFFVTLMVQQQFIRYGIWMLMSATAFYLLIADVPSILHPASGISCFFGGAITYAIYRKLHGLGSLSKPISNLLEILCLAAIYYVLSQRMEYQQEIASLLFCLTVLIFANEGGLIAQTLRKGVFQMVGKLSYSIYLIHVLVITLVLLSLRIISKFVPNTEFAPLIKGLRHIDLGAGWLNTLAMLAIVGLIIWLSQFTYRYVELKWQQIGKNL